MSDRFFGREMSRSCVGASLLLSLAWASPAFAQAVNRAVSGTMPTYGQHHDFRSTYDDRLTDIRNAGDTAWVKYKDLAADTRVRVVGNKFEAHLGPTQPGRDFADADYYTTDAALYDTRENLAGGSWHCAPTSASMVYDWFRGEKLKKLANRGNEKATIDYFARAADTNDYSYDIAAYDSQGHFGTDRSAIWNALNTAVTSSHADYAKAAGPRVKNYTYAQGAYTTAIDKDRALMLHYRGTAGTAGGHVVAGFGYQAFGTGPHPPGTVFGPRVIDPWDKQTKLKGWDTMTGAIASVEYATGNPRTTTFDSDWGDTMMAATAIPDYGDAPYQFEDNDLMSSSKPAASHRDNYAQWLGRGVSGETNKFDALDDEDGVANTTFAQPNMDSDDGASFLYNADGSVLATVISTKCDFSRDLDNLAAPTGLFLSVFADNDRDFDFRTGFAITFALGDLSFNGTGALEEILTNVALPGAADGGQFWVRFRLSRDANCDAYGLSEYGEVEDYLVPTPGGTALFSIGAVLASRRRRPLASA